MKKRPALVTAISCVLMAAGVAGLAYHVREFASADKLDSVFALLVRALAIVAGAVARSRCKGRLSALISRRRRMVACSGLGVRGR